MKFSCNTDLLSKAIANVSLAVSPKSNLTALEGILVQAHANVITLMGYNLELGITTSIPATIEETGEVIIPAKLFSEIIRKTESEEISIYADSRFLVEIKAGVSQFTILGMSPLEFPELPNVGEDTAILKLPQNTLRSMISQTIFAVATTDAKPVHTGCLFNLEKNQITVVAVDGFRLALRKENIQVEEPIKFIVPGKNLADLLKLLDDSDDLLELQISKRHILFTTEQYSVISRLLEGDFLDYIAAIPKEISTTVEINTRSMINSIERTALLISDRLKSPLRIEFGDNLVKMSCSTTIGKAYDECSCNSQGPQTEMGFNNRYLMDALRNADTDIVRLEISGPLSPMKVLPPEGDQFLFLVLPMRLKNE